MSSGPVTPLTPLQALPILPILPYEISSGHPLKRAKTLSSSNLGELPTPEWSSSQQQNFAKDLCRMFTACGMSWNMADNPEMHLFMERWIPGSTVPDRRALSGIYLDHAVEDVQLKTKVRVQGKMATGQCDGWKNVAKTSIIMSVMTVQNETHLVRTHNMTGEPKTGDRLHELVVSDISYMSETYGVKTIGWCTDDGPDGKKM
ncbi:hypothetical protein B0H21DRAFT_827975 [Amylocystis lapponica]|nr:hypothetical protein B0H21DRAFT_827975 [Amylocystis lapponica]